MIDASRRSLLRNGARVALGSLGAGVLLPWSGTKALTIVDAGAVTAAIAPMPFSEECLRLRAIKREFVAVPSHPHSMLHARWWELNDAYQASLDTLLARPATSWGHCVELAEVAWHYSPKIWEQDCRLTRRLVGSDGIRRNEAAGYAAQNSIGMRVVPALIESVLSMGSGERYDPKIERGLQR